MNQEDSPEEKSPLKTSKPKAKISSETKREARKNSTTTEKAIPQKNTEKPSPSPQPDPKVIPKTHVKRIKMGSKEFILIGTAHISQESVVEVRDTILAEKPDHVCVEIDEMRYQSLTHPEEWKNNNIFKIFSEKKGALMIVNLLLSSFQQRMGEETGVKPGQEMLEAIELAKELKIPYSFCDRSSQITLKRAWRKSSFWNKNKLIATIVSSFFSNEKISSEELEELKGKSLTEGLMDELTKELPAVKEVLIDERDAYLAAHIYKAEGNKIVAVVGAGHVNGIIKRLEELNKSKTQPDLSELDVIPPPSPIIKILPWAVPILIIGLIISGFYFSGKDVGINMIVAWFLINGTSAALAALLTWAHPLNIVIAFCLAPITALNPMIGIGVVCAMAETWLRPPRVRDLETAQKEIGKVGSWYKNRFLHVFLVFIGTSLGGAVGTWIGITALLRM